MISLSWAIAPLFSDCTGNWTTSGEFSLVISFIKTKFSNVSLVSTQADNQSLASIYDGTVHPNQARVEVNKFSTMQGTDSPLNKIAYAKTTKQDKIQIIAATQLATKILFLLGEVVVLHCLLFLPED